VSVILCYFSIGWLSLSGLSPKVLSDNIQRLLRLAEKLILDETIKLDQLCQVLEKPKFEWHKE